MRKRRYLLNTNVPLSAYYEWIARKRGVRLQPYTLQWLRRYGRLSYYSNLLELELRGTPIKSHVISLLRSYGVERLSSDKGRLRRRAVRLLKEYGLSLRFIVDAMYVLLAKEYGLVIVSYDKDIELLANILGVACKRPLGNLVACNIYPSKAVERAVKEVRRIRDRIGVLVELGEKAREKGRGDEADKILDAFFEGIIGYQEAYTALKKLAN